jgi:hypothetical protein
MLESHKTSPEKLKLVSRYMTPYAALLVLMGLYFGRPPKIEMWLTLGILAVSLAVNLGSMIGLEKAPAQAPLIRDLRVAINVVCNFWLIFILLPYWPEIWMLLLLVVIALSVYESRKKTFRYCCAFSCLLVFIAYLKGLTTGVRLGQVLIYAATLVCVGLFINRLIGLVEAANNPAGADGGG